MQNAAAVWTLQACKLALLPTLANIVRSISLGACPYSRHVGVFVPQSTVPRCAGGTVELALEARQALNLIVACCTRIPVHVH